MKNLLLILAVFLFFRATAQDTIWFNKNWINCSKAEAMYYRTAEKQEGGAFLVTDWYKATDRPQMIALSSTIDPTFKIGKCTFYYPYGGKESEGYYAGNKKTGFWVSWKENGDSVVTNYGIAPRKLEFHPTAQTREQEVRDSIFMFNSGRTMPKSTRDAYDAKSSVFSYEKRGFSIIPRGKVATMFIIEDLYFLTYTLGMELSYNRHRIGLDATWFRWRSQTDDNDDREMYDELELRRYLYADYKFIFLHFGNQPMNIYFNAYYKRGTYNDWYHPYDYPGVGAKMFLQNTKDGTFSEPGAGFGLRIGDPFGIDISANVGNRITITDNKVYFDSGTYTIEHNAKLDENVFYMRLNLFYRFGD